MAQGLDEREALAEMIELHLGRSGFRLAFPAVLEQLFEAETGADRSAMFVRYSLVGLVIYGLVLLDWFNTLPDVALRMAFVQFVIVTPLSLVTLACMRMRPHAAFREVMPAIVTVLSLVAAMVVYQDSKLPVATLYRYSPVLTLLFLNVILSVRFPYALAASLAVLLLSAIDICELQEVIPGTRVHVVSCVLVTCAFTLVANYKLDWGQRRAFLLTACERLRRLEMARIVAEQTVHHEARVRNAALLEAGTASFGQVAGAALDDFAHVSGEMRGVAEELACASGAAVQRAASMAAEAEKASAHVEATAAAVEQLSLTAVAVSREVAASIEMADQAVERAGHTTATIERLSGAAAEIGAVVSTISGIAGRTKLLALNATIEAARAGAAGRGFTVVAEEVKALAGQAAQATGMIAVQVGAIQACTAEAVDAITGIDATIGQISVVAGEVAAAMRQQAAATAEISRSVAGAARSAVEVSCTAGAVKHDAEALGTVAVRVLSAAGAVEDRERGLRTHVTDFLADIRAA